MIKNVRYPTEDERILFGPIALVLEMADGGTLFAYRPPIQEQLPAELVALATKLNTYFGLGELQTLCFNMGLDHEAFYHGTKTELVQGMVRYCHGVDRVNELVGLCRIERPKVNWE